LPETLAGDGLRRERIDGQDAGARQHGAVPPIVL